MATKNPLYPGYHPGEKIERYPSSRYREYKGEYTPSKFNEYLEKLGDGEGFNIPKWAWEQEKAGLDITWKAMYYGTDTPTSSDVGAAEQEELEEIAGSTSVGITLNPVEWVKDPGKQAKNFLVKPVQESLKKDDFVQKARGQVWAKHIMLDDDSPLHLKDGVEVQEERVVKSREETQQSFFVKPDFTEKQSAYSNNLYADTANKAAEYMGDSQSIFQRNKRRADFDKKVLSALDTEVEIKSGRLSSSLSDLEKRKLKDFRDRIKVLDNFDTLNIVGGTGSENKIWADGKSFTIGGSDKKTIKSSLGDAIDKYNKTFLKSKIGVGDWGDIEKSLTELKKSLKDTNNLLDSLERNGAKDIRGLRRYTKNLEKVLDSGVVEKNGKYVLKDNLAGKRFFNSLEVQHKRLYRITADGGIVGGFMQDLVDKNIANKNSSISKILKVKDAADNNIMSEASRRLSNVSSSLKRDWEWQTAGDLADAITQGKIPSQFIWANIVAPRIEKWTPSYLLGQGLKRSHYFGFMVDRSVEKGDLKVNAIGRFFYEHPKLSFIKENTFSIGKSKFTGGEDFESVIGVARLFYAGSKFSEQDLVDFLNGKSILTKFLEEDWNNLFELKVFLLKSDTLRKAMGLELDPVTGQFTLLVKGKAKEFLNNFTSDELLRLGIKPTLKKVGLVQRYGILLNKWKSRFYNSWIGKPFKNLVGWQEVLKQKIAKILSELIAKAFGAVAGPIGWAFGWLVKIISQVVVKRIEQFVSKFWKALKSFDFSEIFEDIEESFYKGIKGCLIFSSFTIVPIFGILFFIIVSILSIFPNFNAGRIGQDATGLGVFFHQGLFNANCGDEVENPSEVIGANNSSSSVARAGFDVVENLERGFWCYFNNSPDYPGLFRNDLYKINPFPPASIASNTWNLLFWCTFLPWKSGADIPDASCYNPSTGESVSKWRADGMQYCYQNAPGNRYVSADEAYVTSSGGNVQSNILAGDVIFINSGDSTRPSNHVGLVYEVTPDYIISVQSNTGLKVWHYPVADDGSILGAFSHQIIGFGR